MQIIMPKLGLTMTHGTITEWLKAPGDAVKGEEALCAYETEKVTLELVAPEDGVLAEILAPAGTSVPAGEVVCEFWTKNEARTTTGAGERGRSGAGELLAGIGGQQPASRFPLPASSALNATPKARVLARELGVDLACVAGSGPDGRVQARDVEAAHAGAQPAPVKATPLARRIAAAEGLDLRSVSGTRPDGTVTREDVEAAAKGVGSGRDEQVVPHSVFRRTIADRMSHSAFTAPHVTLMTEAEATNLVSARAQLNQELAEAHKISYNTLLAALTAKALREYPNINARWETDGIHLLPGINVALAVDTERGLMTPVLRDVDKLDLPAVERGYGELIARALSGKSRPDDFAGGTFTITNLGGLDVDGFTPIINPPHAAILGVGRIVDKPVARDGAVVIRPMITLSLSFDHRIVDGAPAARFLQRLKQLVERPVALLLR
jgi:pyruvate dehydrogenase E2 component (dihydrolipoamide acetyltransferase)